MTLLSVPADSPFGLTNLPYGAYTLASEGASASPRLAVRYGDSVVDLALLLGDDSFAVPTLNSLMTQGHSRWVSVRSAIAAALQVDVAEAAVHALSDVRLHLPFEVADYVDFYASEYHASNLGRLFRPDNPEPLMPNWKWLPVGYHGRSASIVVSGTDIPRPSGQRKGKDDPVPTFGPSTRLDIEAELGFVVGTGNDLGTAITADDAATHIFGVMLFNDWSARDIQAWEYVPLGPNLGKSFASTVSAWVTPLLALEAARVPTPVQDPAPLPYLAMQQPWGLDISLEVEWNGQVVSRPPYAAMYWSPAQMLAHLTVNGARTRPGDLYASGTISGPDKSQRGALIELTWGGAEPVEVGGRPSTFLQDGDEIVLRATAPGADGTTIALGECRGRIVPSPRTPTTAK